MESYNKLPQCPYCGQEDEEWWDGTGMKYDGDHEEHRCAICLKSYETLMCVDYKFITKKIEESK